MQSRSPCTGHQIDQALSDEMSDAIRGATLTFPYKKPDSKELDPKHNADHDEAHRIRGRYRGYHGRSYQTGIFFDAARIRATFSRPR